MIGPEPAAADPSTDGVFSTVTGWWDYLRGGIFGVFDDGTPEPAADPALDGAAHRRVSSALLIAAGAAGFWLWTRR